MIGWYKFLLKESEEYKLDPKNMSREEFTEKFIYIWKQNKAFRDKLINDIIKLEIDNNFKQMPRDHQYTYYRIIAGSQSMDDPVGNEGRTSYHYVTKFMNDNFSNVTAVQRLTQYTMYYLLKKYFGKNTKDVVDYFEWIKDQPLNFINAYRALYYNFETYMPTIPKISYVSGDNISDTKKYNINFFKKIGYTLDRQKLIGKNILDNIKLKSELGSGAHGRVFSTEDGRAFKFFASAEDLDKDLKRMKKIEKQIYSGTASVEDMAYFESGKLGDTSFYYSLMPEIIPITKAPFYQYSYIFNDIANFNKSAALHFGGKKVTYQKFKNFVVENAKKAQSSGYSGYNFDEDYEKYPETIDKIIKAGYRAYIKFGGEDIHSNNIGYIRQKPDIFFYFDM